MTMPLAASVGPLTTTATWCESWQRWPQNASPARRVPRRLLTDPMDPIVVTLSLPHSAFVAEVPQPEPAWLYPALDRLQRLSRLGDNWDSYGGRAPADEDLGARDKRHIHDERRRRSRWNHVFRRDDVQRRLQPGPPREAHKYPRWQKRGGWPQGQLYPLNIDLHA